MEQKMKVDYNQSIRERPVREKVGVIFAVAACANVLGYNVLINSSLAACMQEFGVSLTEVQQLSNLPSLISLLGSLMAAKAVGLLGRKTVSVFACAICFLTGVLPAFTSLDFTGILVVRAIGGFFTGLMIPMATSMIADYFSGTQKRFMFGFNMAVSSLISGVILNQVAGFLANTGWRNTYFIFFYLAVCVVLCLIGVPSQPKEQRKAMEAQGQIQKFSDVFKQTGKVWEYAVLLALFVIAGHIHSINASNLIMEKGLGSAAVTATTFSFMTAGGVIGSLSFAFLSKALKKFTAPVLMIPMIVGMGACLGPASGVWMAYLGAFLFGLSFGPVSSIFNNLIGVNADPVKTVGALALANIMYNGGQYLTSFVINGISGLVATDANGNPFASNNYFVGAVYCAIFCLVIFFLALRHKQGEGDHIMDF